jgi:hypothetical protein
MSIKYIGMNNLKTNKMEKFEDTKLRSHKSKKGVQCNAKRHRKLKIEQYEPS